MAFQLRKGTVYHTAWTVINSEVIAEESLRDVISAVVVDSEKYEGRNVRIDYRDGTYEFLPLSKHSRLNLGDEVNLAKGKVETLRRGESTCTRFIED